MSHPKLSELTTDGAFAAKVGQVLAQLEARNETPRIFETKRTLAQQVKKVRAGYSRTLKSQHVDRGSDGGALAADIADSAKGWNASRRFWLIIGAACQSYGLGWGGLFGLNGRQKGALVAALNTLRAAGWPEDHEAYAVSIGWDPAHLQKRPNW